MTGGGWNAGGEPTVAVCNRGLAGSGRRLRRHRAPEPGCGCGLYAVHPHAAQTALAYLGGASGPAGCGRGNRRGVGAGRGARGWVPGPVRAADRDRRRRGSPGQRHRRDPRPARSPVPRRAGRGRRPSRPRRLLSRPWPGAVASRSFARWSRSSHALAQSESRAAALGGGGLGSASGCAWGSLGWRRFSGTASSPCVGVTILIAVINGDFGSSGEPFSARKLRVIDQALVRTDDGLRYVAVVRNTSEKRVALAAFARGKVLDRDGDRVVRLGGREQGRLATDAAAGRDRGRGRRAARSRAPDCARAAAIRNGGRRPARAGARTRSPRSRWAIRRSTAVGAGSASRWRRAGRLAGPGSRSSPATQQARSAARGRSRSVAPRSSEAGGSCRSASLAIAPGGCARSRPTRSSSPRTPPAPARREQNDQPRRRSCAPQGELPCRVARVSAYYRSEARNLGGGARNSLLRNVALNMRLSLVVSTGPPRSGGSAPRSRARGQASASRVRTS